VHVELYGTLVPALILWASEYMYKRKDSWPAAALTWVLHVGYDSFYR